MKYTKILPLVVPFVLLAGCQDKGNDTVEKENKNEINSEVKKNDSVENKTETLVYERTEEKNYFYGLVISCITSALNNKKLENTSQYVSSKSIYSKAEEPLESVLLEFYVDVIKNYDEKQFNTEEKKVKDIMVEYLTLKKDFVLYIEPFMDKNRALKVPKEEEANYTQRVNEMNQLLIDNKYLLLDTMEAYFSVEMVGYDQKNDDIVNYINYQQETGRQIISDMMAKNELTDLSQAEVVFEEYPLMGVLYYNANILVNLEEKSKETLLNNFEKVRYYLNKEKSTEQYKRFDFYKEYIQFVEDFSRNEEFLEFIDKGDYRNAKKEYFKYDMELNKKFGNKMTLDESKTTLYSLRTTINLLKAEISE